MSNTTATKENYNLLTWLTHIKHLHDVKKVIPLLSNTTTSTSKINTPVSSLTAITKQKNKDNNTIHKNGSSSTTTKKNIIFQKDNLIHFHRPHGLFLMKKQSKKRNPTTLIEHECSCCAQGCCSGSRFHRHSTSSLSSNMADDELDSQEEDGINRHSPARSVDGTRLPPCMCPINNDKIEDKDEDDEEEEENEDDISTKSPRSRESSIYALPGELDSPEVGFKQLQKDGDLVDYDDISDLTDDAYFENCITNVQSHSRSAVHNSLIRLALNGPFQSPLDKDKKKQVLHVGCGNGDWCVDIATYFPNWLVVGIDDKTGGPIRDHKKCPKNFKFIRCYFNLLRTLKDIPSNSFDLIYCRFLIFTYGKKKYNDLIKEAYRICKPGGYVEFYELDMRIYGNPKAGPMTHQLNTKVFRSMEQHSLDPRLARDLGAMVSTYFNRSDQKPSTSDSTDTKQFKKEHFNFNYTSLPLGVWGGKLGVMFRDDINDLFQNFEINQEEYCHNRQKLLKERRCNSSDSSDTTTTTTTTSCSTTICDSMNNWSMSDTNIPDPEELEAMNLELDSDKSFMNLYHVYAQKNRIEEPAMA